MQFSAEKSQIWQQLLASAQAMPSLYHLFEQNPQRGSQFCVQACDITMDFSKQKIDTAVLQSLLNLAKASDLSQKIHDLMAGEKVNDTENRPALHTALRLPKDKILMVAGENITEQVHTSLAKAEILVNRIRDGVWRGYSGKAITDVVNIGWVGQI